RARPMRRRTFVRREGSANHSTTASSSPPRLSDTRSVAFPQAIRQSSGCRIESRHVEPKESVMSTTTTTVTPTGPAAGAITITEHELQQCERANATGLQPIVFVHGLWLLPSSWDRWVTVFEDAGYAALTPGWPDDPVTVQEANANPQVFAHKTVGQVADHF